ncbi:hypothetical protein ABC795_14070 [Blastococcus sp. HT6-30]|uniref:hypothetical protein n=1 Tax=Blastococcus sp. HT6-30 TaxID=3144843 RepID=UPI00321970D8
MTSMTWAAASDLLVRGGADVREGGLSTTGATVLIQGTGPSVAAGTRGNVATGLIGSTAGTGSSRVAPVAIRRPESQHVVERFLAPTYLPQDDATTPGLRVPGRPLS